MQAIGSLDELAKELRRFADERDWQRFHGPKNLAAALSVEAAELLEIFQWLEPNEAADIMRGAQATAVRHELADVFNYLVRLADVLGVDLLVAAREKIELNALKYPAERARGRADKYHAYEDD